MKYCVDTPKQGWILKPRQVWNGKDKDFQFTIRGKADSDYAKCPQTSVLKYSIINPRRTVNATLPKMLMKVNWILNCLLIVELF